MSFAFQRFEYTRDSYARPSNCGKGAVPLEEGRARAFVEGRGVCIIATASGLRKWPFGTGRLGWETRVRRVCIVSAVVVVLFGSCGAEPSGKPNPAESIAAGIDLPEIRARAKLIAITSYSATSYFIYKGQPMGFQYELLTRLAERLGLDVEIVLAKDLDEIFAMLERGDGDLVAYGLTVTKSRAENLDFAEHYATTRQVLVQRKPDNWRDMKRHEIDAQLVRNQIDLIGKPVHVRKGSSYIERLENLSAEVGGDIRIIEAGADVTTEDLIARVAAGSIEYTVADEHIALINKARHSNVDVETPISFPQRLAWAVRKNAPQLLEAVNAWVIEARGTAEFAVIRNRYFKEHRAFRERMKSDYFIDVDGGAISEYDDLLRERAAVIPWDWRLLASLIYQESGFDPDAESWAGAVGLMQLLPRTGEAYGAKNLRDPIENVTAGTNYLKYLNEQWAEVRDAQERVKFVLASYNVGDGHVEDAQRLAVKYGKDPGRWDSVAAYMVKLSDERFFNDDAVEHGYCRGEETVDYVNEILERLEHYKKFIPRRPSR